MLKAFIEKILDLGRNEIVEIEGVRYSTKSLNLVYDPSPKTLEISTLDGIVTFVEQLMPDDAGKPIIHIEDYNKVSLRGNMHPLTRQRFHFLASKFDPCDWTNLERPMDLEEATVKLQSMFVDDDERKRVIPFLSKIVSSTEATLSDSGYEQTATITVGIKAKGVEKITLPVFLCPFRTFPEIEQPSSPFYMRLEKNGTVYFKSADGSAWKTEAKKRIKDYLSEKLLDNVVIIG